MIMQPSKKKVPPKLSLPSGSEIQPTPATSHSEKEKAPPAPAQTQMAVVLPLRGTPNRRLLRCLVDGDDALVSVRDAAYYRAGEIFDVRKNEGGRWEATVHRTQPRRGR